ncbi:MAG: hypothetical protein JNK73_06350 [Bacteroidia bacterium]|nr:hypothetical protein [Bacteroidia bacterium]
MKKINQIMSEIIDLTTEIEVKYPELYQYLDETPITICKTPEKEICMADLEGYLNTLKNQLMNHIATHTKTKL